ncbi:MAG: insulinase family protein [Clostridiaceae bacterium]|jgi:predicted Zn-dependent peptidase|nr:insulinase family protein [Clostridiaceae bacterium]
MESATVKTTAEKLAEKDGIAFYRINSNKFKTNRVDIFFLDCLERQRASANAIIPSVLKRGCKEFATQKELEARLEELYGASVDGSCNKKGETQIVSFHMSHIADSFTSGRDKLFDQCSQLLMCILKNPVVEDNGFKVSVFRQERDNLIDYIRSRINDKMRFSFFRCIEEMCSGEAFAIPDEGYEEDALLLTPQKTFAIYQEMIASYPCFVYMSGSIDDESAHRFIEQFSQITRTGIKRVEFPDTEKTVKEVKRVDESMNVNQGKLCLGFRTNIAPSSADYYPLVVYNGILGGDVHSKLFRNVREKASLAYFAQSILEKYKGLMLIMSGIEKENRDKAEEIILRQFEDVRKGKITREEMDATKKSLRTGIKAMQDSQGAIVDFFLSQHLTGDGEDFETIAEKLEAVTIDDVVRVAGKIRLDTIYFLKPDEAQPQADPQDEPQEGGF